MDKNRLGKFGECLALKYLKSKGYKIISKNFRCRFGEIDIIARYKDFYIFVEVKTRQGNKYGKPIEAINKIKISHLIKTINYYIVKYNISNQNIRIDAIEVIYKNDNNYDINHIENII